MTAKFWILCSHEISEVRYKRIILSEVCFIKSALRIRCQWDHYNSIIMKISHKMEHGWILIKVLFKLFKKGRLKRFLLNRSFTHYLNVTGIFFRIKSIWVNKWVKYDVSIPYLKCTCLLTQFGGRVSTFVWTNVS